MKRKFSRSIAALLSATMVLSVGVTSVFATTADEDGYSSLFQCTEVSQATSLINATATSVSGIAGKAANDSSILLKYKTDGSGERVYINGGDLKATTKYFVCEVNAKYVNTSIALYGSAHNPVGQAMTTNDGKWHKVLWYIDVSEGVKTGADDTYPAYTYVDGTLANTGTVKAAAVVVNGALGMNIRLGMPKGASAISEAYLDDIHVYGTNVAPTADKTAPTALNSVTNAVVSADKLNVSGDVTLNEILAANSGTTVRAYTNSAMTNQVANTAKLKSGNVIVTENAANKALEYYTVDKGDGYRSIIETADGDLTTDGGTATVTKARFTESKETGNAGKLAEDASVILSHNGSGDNDTQKQSMHIGINYKRQDNEKYLVFEANVILHDKVGTTDGYFVVRQNGNGAMSAAVKGIQDGKWHKVLFYLDMTDTAALKSKMFVDGKEYGVGYPSNAQESIANNTTNMDFRFCFEGGSSTMVAHIDDISFYAINVEPTAAQTAPTALNAASGMMIGKNSININANSNVTLNAIKAANTNVAARAYTDSNMTAAVADDAILAEGNVVVTENADNGALKYYNVDLKAETVSVSGNVSSNTVSGAITATPDFSDENNIVVVAQYNDAGALIKAAVSASENAAVEFTPDNVANSKIRIFAFNSLANIKPLLDAALEYTYSAGN